MGYTIFFLLVYSTCHNPFVFWEASTLDTSNLPLLVAPGIETCSVVDLETSDCSTGTGGGGVNTTETKDEESSVSAGCAVISNLDFLFNSTI